MATKGLRKFKFERQLGRAVMNPMVAAWSGSVCARRWWSNSRPQEPSPASPAVCRWPDGPTTPVSG